jgi:lysyl-tRNA synthetase class 2
MRSNLPLALAKRAEIIRAVRNFFDRQGFIEVETPSSIIAPAPEEYIDCPLVAFRDGHREFLRASPELQMKKLLALGMERIYQIGPCFREGERGSRHNPEFTMLEWYRKGATYEDLKNDLSTLIPLLPYSDNFKEPFKTISVRDAYAPFALWDPWINWDRDKFDFDMATKIEPAIKEMGGGVFLTDYPPEAASLAETSPLDNSSLKKASRWEFYLNGIEIANAFSELCDKAEQTRRFEESRKLRQQIGEADYPIDYEFLDILPSMGKASGAALGIDRLIMALLDAEDISSVRAQP